MSFSLGLTGSIGMGKSTAAKMFAEYGCKTWAADAVVADIYQNDKQAIDAICALNPKVIRGGSVSKTAMREWITNDKTALKKIEDIIHPIVAAHRAAFLQKHKGQVLVFEVPLLYEKNTAAEYDAVATVLTDSETQNARVMARGTMTQAQLDLIKQQQIPAEEKAARADFIIRSDTLESARQDIETIIKTIKANA